MVRPLPSAVVALLLLACSLSSVSALDCHTYVEDCSGCMTNSSCAFCAFERGLQGSGVCVLSTETPCVDPQGSWITQPSQCAAANDSCAHYTAGGCDACGKAPLSLNCGQLQRESMQRTMQPNSQQALE